MPALLSSNIKYNQLVPIVLIMFMFNPMLTLVGLLLYGLSIGDKQTNDTTQGFLILFGLLCCVAVSFINTTKIPEGDLWEYVYKYHLADNYNYFRFLLVGPGDVVETIKEPAFYSLVWAMNRLFEGNVGLFLFGMSMLEYMLLTYAIIWFGKVKRMRIYVVMTGIIVMCFLPYIFFHSMNIIRQFLANALLLYIIIRHFFYGKREWFSMLIMVLVHTSSALFLPLLLIPEFGKPLKKSWVWFVGATVLLLGFQEVAGYLLGASDISQESAIGYALARAERGNAGYYDISNSVIAVCLLFLMYSIYLSIKTSLDDEGIRKFMATIIILTLFVVIMRDQGLIASRFGHYVFTFLPFLLMIFFQSTKIDNVFQFLFSLMTILFFLYFIGNTAFTFEVEFGGLFTPGFIYILNMF